MSALLALSDSYGLVRVKRTDLDCRLLADRHYSRQSVGAREFMGNGSTLVLRNVEGTLVFGWLRSQGYHVNSDGLDACCTIFRNEGVRRSSEVILEAEREALDKWPDLTRFWTYIDPDRVASPNPGYCFKQAGWRFVGLSKRGLHLLEKEAPR